MNAPRLRTLLVDDEMLARLALRQALASHPEVDIVGECGNATEAMQALHVLRPDLLFLDIRMPGLDGFELLQQQAADHLPLVVFATASDGHALRAFDARAIDYILKPIEQSRFDQAMTRVNRHWQGLHADGPGVPAGGCTQRLSVRHGEHHRVLAVSDIDWIRADGNYLQIHAGTSRYLYRDTLTHLLSRLDPAHFLRIHRGTVVNLARIREVHPLFGGNAEVVLHDGTRLDLSRRFRARAQAALGLR